MSLFFFFFCPHSSSSSSPGMYSKLTSKITGLLGATLGLPGAEVRPFGNANYRLTYKYTTNAAFECQKY